METEHSETYISLLVPKVWEIIQKRSLAETFGPDLSDRIFQLLLGGLATAILSLEDEGVSDMLAHNVNYRTALVYCIEK